MFDPLVLGAGIGTGFDHDFYAGERWAVLGGDQAAGL
jgi:hypothetical protein